MLDSWTIVLALVTLALVALAIALALRGANARSARATALQARVDSAKIELAELRSRRDDGAITSEDFDAEEKRLTRKLIDSATASPTVPTRQIWLGDRRRAMLMAALAVLAGATAVMRARVPVVAPATQASTSAPALAGAAKPLPALSNEQLERMVAEASAQVQKTPDDSHAWAMLAHSYDMLGRFAESSKAYAHLVRLAPRDAQALADYADALAVANGRTLAGEPTVLIERALAIDPRNLKALTLAGTAAFERKDYATAVTFWERARSVSSDANFRREIDASIAESRAAASGGPIGERASRPVVAASAALLSGAAMVSGRVSLADEFTAKLSPDATVFIFARPAKGSSMPVALLRKHVRDLPVDFTLDDSMSMVPGVTLSKAGTVVVGARVSQRGDVTPTPGDVQGWSAPIDVGTTGLKLEMSEVIK